MSELIDTTEMYLRTVFELQEEGVPPLRARIAERLGHSGPTVSQTVARMERDGLLTVQPDRSIQLTDAGSAAATRVMRKHRLAECLLVDVIGLDWPDVHEEACRWEHVMSEAVERRLVELLDHPSVSPFGNPIPGLEELMTDGSGAPAEEDWRPLSAALAEDEREFVVQRIGEHVQHHVELMTTLDEVGIRPGVRLLAARDAEGVRLVGAQGSTVTPEWVAEMIMVARPAAAGEA